MVVPLGGVDRVVCDCPRLPDLCVDLRNIIQRPESTEMVDFTDDLVHYVNLLNTTNKGKPSLRHSVAVSVGIIKLHLLCLTIAVRPSKSVIIK